MLYTELTDMVESQLFKYKSWDLGFDEGEYIYHEIELIVNIGFLKMGSQFDCATINFQKGYIQILSRDGEIFAEYQLLLSIGEKLTN